MSAVHTSIVTPAHGYTRAKIPWILAADSACGRLIRYLAGGGMSTFGRTLQQDLVRRRHRRFAVVSALVGVLWIVFLCV